MIVKSKSRGDAVQLAEYLLDQRDNENIQILDIQGTATPGDLKRSLLEMELTVELTDGTKGLHHVQIAPRDYESREMTSEDWHYCVESYARIHDLEGQKWAGVLHTKNGSTHAHLIFERYDHDTGLLRRDSYNYYKNNKVRQELEQHFGHEQTPWRRDQKHEKSHKESLSQIWDNSENGEDFKQQAEALGYHLAKGLDRRPFKVITPDGKSLDLVKQLKGVNTAQVKKELEQIKLQTEAEALRQISLENKQKIESERRAFQENNDDIRGDVEDDLFEQLIKKQKELEQKMRQNGMDQGLSY